MEPTSSLKRCPSCEKMLQRDSFSKNKTNCDGLQNYCRKCHVKKVRASFVKRMSKMERRDPPTEKWCPGCKQIIPLAGWTGNKNKADGLQDSCTLCVRKYNKKWLRDMKLNAPERWKKRTSKECDRQFLARLKKYDLTLEDYDRMAAKGCGICGGPPNGKPRYGLDHDHKTGKFRGLLCSRCNTGIGQFLDCPDLLTKAIEYLGIQRT